MGTSYSPDNPFASKPVYGTRTYSPDNPFAPKQDQLFQNTLTSPSAPKPQERQRPPLSLRDMLGLQPVEQPEASVSDRLNALAPQPELAESRPMMPRDNLPLGAVPGPPATSPRVTKLSDMLNLSPVAQQPQTLSGALNTAYGAPPSMEDPLRDVQPDQVIQAGLTPKNPAARSLTGPARLLAEYVVNPALENPGMTMASLLPPVGLAMAGMGAKHVVDYGAQKWAEGQLPPDVRAMAEKDPTRISGESAIMNAAMLAAPIAGYVGWRKLNRAADVSGGMMEAGARGVGAEMRAEGAKLGRDIKSYAAENPFRPPEAPTHEAVAAATAEPDVTPPRAPVTETPESIAEFNAWLDSLGKEKPAAPVEIEQVQPGETAGASRSRVPPADATPDQLEQFADLIEKASRADSEGSEASTFAARMKEEFHAHPFWQKYLKMSPDELVDLWQRQAKIAQEQSNRTQEQARKKYPDEPMLHYKYHTIVRQSPEWMRAAYDAGWAKRSLEFSEKSLKRDPSEFSKKYAADRLAEYKQKREHFEKLFSAAREPKTGTAVTRVRPELPELPAHLLQRAETALRVADKAWEVLQSKINPTTGKRPSMAVRQKLEAMESRAVQLYRKVISDIREQYGDELADEVHARVGADKISIFDTKAKRDAADARAVETPPEVAALPPEPKALPPVPPELPDVTKTEQRPPVEEPKSVQKRIGGAEGEALWNGPASKYMELREAWDDAIHEGDADLAKQLRAESRAELAKLTPDERELAARYWYQFAGENVADASPHGGAHPKGTPIEQMKAEHARAKQQRNRARTEYDHAIGFDADAPPTFVPGPRGRETRVLFRDGRTEPARYAIVEGSTLVSSHDPFSFNPSARYPEGVQGRDYQRNKAAQVTIEKRSLEFNPDLALNPSESVGEGPPTILHNGVVIAGNERSMLARRAAVHAPAKYKAYVAALRERAESLGIDPRDLDTMEQPVLVRVLSETGNQKRWAELNRLSDEVGTKAKSAVEEGAARASKLVEAEKSLRHFAETIDADTETLSAYLSGANGKKFVKLLVEEGVITPEEYGRIADPETGALTEDGRASISRMMLSAAVSDASAILDAPASILTKLEHAVPSLVTNKGTKFDLTRITTGALKMLAEARDRGLNVHQLAAQTSMLDAPRSSAVTELAKFLDANKATDVKTAFRRYATIAHESLTRGESGIDDMFGGTAIDTPAEAFVAAFKKELADVVDPNAPLTAPEMRGRITARELAERAKKGETRRAVEDITGEKPMPLSKDKRQSEIFTDEDLFGPEVSEDAPPVTDKGDDQLAMFSPAKKAVPRPPRPAPELHEPPATAPLPPRSIIDRLRGKKPTPEILSMIKISRGFAKAMDFPLRLDRMRLKAMKAAGAFWPQSEGVRVRKWGALDTVAHEAGHYIAKHWLGNPTNRFKVTGARALARPMVNELVTMGKNLYGSRKPTAGYAEEGIAEWISFYVTEHGRHTTEAPQFSAFMDVLLKEEPMLKNNLDWARQQYEAHQKATPQARASAKISVGEKGEAKLDARAMIQKFVDDLGEFDYATKELERIGGVKLPEEHNPKTLAQLAGGAGAIAENITKHGVPEFGTNRRVTRGLEAIYADIPHAELDAFREYLYARRTLEVGRRGIETGLSQLDALAIVKETHATKPHHLRAAEELWDTSNALIDYLRDGGLLTPEEAKFIKGRNKHRVPLQRVFTPEEAASARLGGSKPAGKNSSGVFRMKGSERDVIDPLEGMVRDIYDTVRRVANHQPVMRLAQLALKTEGGGRIIERVATPQKRVSIAINKIKSQLEDLGIYPEGGDASDPGWDASHEGILQAFEDLQAPGKSESKDLVTRILVNGEPQWIQVKDRRLYDAVRGLGETQFSDLLKLTGFFTRTLRAGSTLTADFAAANIFRDAFTAAAYTKTGARVPFQLLARGVLELVKRGDAYHAWQLEGGDQAAMLAQDRGATQKTLADLLATSKRDKTMRIVKNPIDGLRMMSALAENATRLGESARYYEQAKKAGKSEGAARKGAALAAREVTQDFHKAGVITRSANQLMPFFSARLGGNVKMLKELKERPAQVLPAILATTTIPSIALYLMQKDDPDYNDVPEWQHALAHIIVTRNDDGSLKRIYRIPRAPGIGTFFGYAPVQILKWLKTEDPEALDNLANRMLQDVNPTSVPPGFLAVGETWANKSVFRDRKVVPADREKLEPSEQFTPYSGDFSRQVGRWTNTSPAHIENVSNVLGGGLAGYGLGVADAATRAARKSLGMERLSDERPPAEDLATTTPVARRFTVRRPGGDAESVQRFYREFADANRKRDTWRSMIKEGRRLEAADFLREHRRQIEAVASSKDTGGDAGTLRHAYDLMNKIQEKSKGSRADAVAIGNMLRAVANNPAVKRAYLPEK